MLSHLSKTAPTDAPLCAGPLSRSRRRRSRAAIVSAFLLLYSCGCASQGMGDIAPRRSITHEKGIRNPVGLLRELPTCVRSRCPICSTAFGWAQTHSHGDILARRYARSSRTGGRILWGGGARPMIAGWRPTRSRRVHVCVAGQAQTPAFRANLEALRRRDECLCELAHPQELDDAARRGLLLVDASDVNAARARARFSSVRHPMTVADELPPDAPPTALGTA